jgi:hypothetical protein
MRPRPQRGQGWRKGGLGNTALSQSAGAVRGNSVPAPKGWYDARRTIRFFAVALSPPFSEFFEL